MINFENGVEFDPGYSPYVAPFSENINSFIHMLSHLKAPHQKKFKFQVFAPQIYKLFENIISFYQGCLLWAVYISATFKDEPKNILNNFSLDKNVEEYDFLYETNFVIDYFEQFEKDSKYFLGKTANLPPAWLVIAKVYKEFLSVNDNFVNTRMTSDIKLPSQILEINDKIQLDNILSKIQQSIENKDLSSLLELNLIK